MEKRAEKRVCISLEGELTYNNTRYPVFIVNISKYGLHTLALLGESVKEITPETMFEMEIHLPTGETVQLDCRKSWTHKTILSHTATRRVGIKIIDPPPKFEEFIKTLS
ncbi:MAG: PilZ domain-containing protein [Nitrospiraceae bacterium]|nr:MAG: PilZ domain-containing protein [Nitrospiraceae bacterium]